MGNQTGRNLTVMTWGESHGPAIGAVIDGCPPGVSLRAEQIQAELDRRRPGQSTLTTARSEADRVQILSGVFEGVTLGTPISLLIPNKDAHSSDYEAMRDLYRPSHADYTYEARFGLRDWRGGGRASARETAARVAAGAVAREVLAQLAGVEILAWTQSIGVIRSSVTPEAVSREAVESGPTRCPDREASQAMEEAILQAASEGDSLGGEVRALARGVPAGLGSPVFRKLEAELAGAMLSIPAAKAFASGAGFEASRRRGSENNDPFVPGEGGPQTLSNHSGGIQGGISNGMPIWLDVAFKPVATLARAQQTVTRSGEVVTLAARGRHDPCVVPRAVPIVEAMLALVLCDHWLGWRLLSGLREGGLA